MPKECPTCGSDSKELLRTSCTKCIEEWYTHDRKNADELWAKRNEILDTRQKLTEEEIKFYLSIHSQTRLGIAAQIVAGQSLKLGWGTPTIVRKALELSDALIKEAERWEKKKMKKLGWTYEETK